MRGKNRGIILLLLFSITFILLIVYLIIIKNGYDSLIISRFYYALKISFVILVLVILYFQFTSRKK